MHGAQRNHSRCASLKSNIPHSDDQIIGGAQKSGKFPKSRVSCYAIMLRYSCYNWYHAVPWPNGHRAGAGTLAAAACASPLAAVAVAGSGSGSVRCFLGGDGVAEAKPSSEDTLSGNGGSECLAVLQTSRCE